MTAKATSKGKNSAKGKAETLGFQTEAKYRQERLQPV